MPLNNVMPLNKLKIMQVNILIEHCKLINHLSPLNVIKKNLQNNC